MVLAVLLGIKTAAFVLFVLMLSVKLTFQLQTTTEIHNCGLVSLLEQPEDLRSKERRFTKMNLVTHSEGKTTSMWERHPTYPFNPFFV